VKYFMQLEEAIEYAKTKPEKISVSVRKPDAITFRCRKCKNKGKVLNLKKVSWDNLYVHCKECDLYYYFHYDYKFAIDSKGNLEYIPLFNEREISKKELMEKVLSKNNI